METPQCTDILLLHNYISDVLVWFFLNIVSFWPSHRDIF